MDHTSEMQWKTFKIRFILAQLTKSQVPTTVNRLVIRENTVYLPKYYYFGKKRALKVAKPSTPNLLLKIV